MGLDFTCKADEPPTEPDVLVDLKTDFGPVEGGWVRIPVTKCELWMNKDGPSDLTRTAKVEFPAEWGDDDMTRFVNGFSGESEAYDECRIWFRDQDDGVYDLAHYGYVGGVGPTTDTGEFKFWVYDAADLMKGIQVSKSFDQPTIQQVLDFVVSGTDDSGQSVGLQDRSVFDNVRVTISGPQEVAIQKADKREGAFGSFVDTEGSEGFQPPDVGGGLLSGAADFFDDAWDIITEVGDDILGGGVRRFQLNRHNMIDVMNWFADEVGGKWHFEPTENGPLLFFDNTAELNPEAEGTEGEIARRRFRATEIENDDGAFSDLDVFDEVDQLDNDALFDIKPFNTLTLYGETSTPKERVEARTGHPVSGAGAYTESFPYVEVQYPPLLDRAGGYEYAPSAVESDKIFLKNAENEAIKQFRKHLEEETEGEVELKGTPHILPYDYMTAVPICNDVFTNVDVSPITYEVNRVKHIREAGDRYRTTCGVSLVMDESLLEVTSEMRDA